MTTDVGAQEGDNVGMGRVVDEPVAALLAVEAG
jgi:hypothetical protein